MSSIKIDLIKKLEKEKSIKLLHVAENGSRAWGYPSPDSDNDIKGVSIYDNPSKYQSVFPFKNFFELDAKEHQVDIMLWDLSKFLYLLSKGNAQCYEIMHSDIHYNDQCLSDDITIKMSHNQLKKFTTEKCMENMRAIAYHYYGIARGVYKNHVAGSGEPTAKKYLYMIRPLIHISHIWNKDMLPELNFKKALDLEKDSIPVDCYKMIEQLLENKLDGKQLTDGINGDINQLDEYIESRLAFWEEQLPDFKLHEKDRILDTEEYDSVFRSIISR